MNLFSIPADGSAAPERLYASPYLSFPAPGRLTDNIWASWKSTRPRSGTCGCSRAANSTPQPFLQTPFSEGWMEFSPNGHWVAYTADESGRWEVYVQPFPGPGAKVPISSEGGTEAVWSRTGEELFYRNRDKMMAVTVTMEPAFTAEKPRVLFEGRYVLGPVPGMVNYDVSRDGQRFLMVKILKESPPAHLDIVLDWFSEVSRRVPSAASK